MTKPKTDDTIPPPFGVKDNKTGTASSTKWIPAPGGPAEIEWSSLCEFDSGPLDMSPFKPGELAAPDFPDEEDG